MVGIWYPFWFTQNRGICICIYEHVVHGRFLRLLRGEPEPFFYMKTDVKWFQFFHFGGVLQAYFINTWTHLLHLDRWIVPLSRQVQLLFGWVETARLPLRNRKHSPRASCWKEKCGYPWESALSILHVQSIIHHHILAILVLYGVTMGNQEKLGYSPIWVPTCNVTSSTKTVSTVWKVPVLPRSASQLFKQLVSLSLTPNKSSRVLGLVTGYGLWARTFNSWGWAYLDTLFAASAKAIPYFWASLPENWNHQDSLLLTTWCAATSVWKRNHDVKLLDNWELELSCLAFPGDRQE